MERDERARNLQAREEGLQEGRQEGAMIGRIQVLQELNGLTCQPADDLARLSVEELGALEIELQQRLREQSEWFDKPIDLVHDHPFDQALLHSVQQLLHRWAI